METIEIRLEEIAFLSSEGRILLSIPIYLLNDWILRQVEPFFKVPSLEAVPVASSAVTKSKLKPGVVSIADVPITVKVKQQKKKRITPNQVSPLETQSEAIREPSEAATTRSSDSIKKFARLYSQLVLKQRLPLVNAIQLICKLASLPVSNVAVSRPPNAPTPDDFAAKVFESNHCVSEFAATALELLIPVVSLFGSRVILCLSATDAVHCFLSHRVAEMQILAEELKGSEVADLMHLVVPEQFLRPFRDETDSRLEYTSQAETSAYNERENLFDALSKTFQAFHAAASSSTAPSSSSSSDASDLEYLRFWKDGTLPLRQKLAVMSPVNAAWFAELFVQMLLVHGLNMSKDAPPLSSAGGESVARPVTSSTRNENWLNQTTATSAPLTSFVTTAAAGKKEKVAPVASGNNMSRPSNSWSGVCVATPQSAGAVTSTLHSSASRTASSEGGKSTRIDRLEERFGKCNQLTPESRVTLKSSLDTTNTGPRRPTCSAACSNTVRSPLLSRFPGNQEFFVRFLMILDSYRLTTCIHDELCWKIHKLSTSLSHAVGENHSHHRGRSDTVESTVSKSSVGEELESLQSSNISVSTTGSEPLAVRVLKLKLLGRFLGFLEFWPHYDDVVIEQQRGESNKARMKLTSPLLLQAQERSQNRLHLRRSLPLLDLIVRGRRQGNLVTVIPWIAEFIQMADLDTAAKSRSHPYKDVLETFHEIANSEPFQLDKGISANRLFVLCEIQKSIKYRDRSISKSPKAKTERLLSGQDAGIDAQGGLFSSIFIRNSLPELWELVEILRTTFSGVKRPPALAPSLERSNTNPAENISTTPSSGSIPRKVDTGLEQSSSSLWLSPDPLSRKSRFSGPTLSYIVSPSSQFKSLAAVELIRSSPFMGNQIRLAAIPDATAGGASPAVKSITPRKLFPAVERCSPATARSNGNKCTPRKSNPQTGSPIGGLTFDASNVSIQDRFLVAFFYLSNFVRLTLTFWQQHPQLLQVFGFLVEHVQVACFARLKELVASSVRALWTISAELKSSSIGKRHTIEENSVDLGVVEEERKDSALEQFERDLMEGVKSTHDSLVRQANEYLSRFVDVFVAKSVHELICLFPSHERVSKLAIFLLKQRLTAQQLSQLNFIDKYGRRKLEEVFDLSVRQQKKLFDGNSRKSLPQCSHGHQIQPPSSSGMTSANFSTEPLEGVGQAFMSLQSTKFFVFQGSEEIVSESSGGYESLQIIASPAFGSSCRFCYDTSSQFCALQSQIQLSCQLIVDLTRALARYFISSPRGSLNRMLVNNFKQIFISFANGVQAVEKAVSRQFAMIRVDLAKLLVQLMPALFSIEHSFESNNSLCGNDSPLQTVDFVHLLIQRDLIERSSAARAFVSTLRSSSIGFHECCYKLKGLRCWLEEHAVGIIGRFLETILSIDGKDSLVIGLDGAWLHDVRLRDQIKRELGPELPALLASLASRKAAV